MLFPKILPIHVTLKSWYNVAMHQSVPINSYIGFMWLINRCLWLIKSINLENRFSLLTSLVLVTRVHMIVGVSFHLWSWFCSVPFPMNSHIQQLVKRTREKKIEWSKELPIYMVKWVLSSSLSCCLDLIYCWFIVAHLLFHASTIIHIKMAIVYLLAKTRLSIMLTIYSHNSNRFNWQMSVIMVVNKLANNWPNTLMGVLYPSDSSEFVTYNYEL